MCAAAKLPKTCEATIENRATIESIIQMAINECNEAFRVGGIPTHLRLVHAHFDADYDDTQNTWPVVFNHFTGKTDGYMDYIHAMRDHYGADFVSFFVNTRGYCGSAHRPTMPNSERVFSMVRWDCATGHYTFTHELSHNMVSTKVVPAKCHIRTEHSSNFLPCIYFTTCVSPGMSSRPRKCRKGYFRV